MDELIPNNLDHLLRPSMDRRRRLQTLTTTSSSRLLPNSSSLQSLLRFISVEKDPLLIRHALRLVSRFSSPALRSLLLRNRADENFSPRIEAEALAALVSVSSPFDDLDLLLSMVSSPVVAVRSLVLDHLSSTLDARRADLVVPLFLDCMADPYLSVRRAALDGLAALFAVGVDEARIEGFYDRAVELFRDRDEFVRSAAVGAVSQWAQMIEANKVEVDERLDLAFVQISSVARDTSVKVRLDAFSALGKLHLVSEVILLQSLSKKFLGVRNGKKAPGLGNGKESKFIVSSAAGIFIHGLEDEFYEVRRVACDSLGKHSIFSLQFADDALNLMMDMLNDDTMAVRLQTLESMFRMASCDRLNVQGKHMHMKRPRTTFSSNVLLAAISGTRCTWCLVAFAQFLTLRKCGGRSEGESSMVRRAGALSLKKGALVKILEIGVAIASGFLLIFDELQFLGVLADISTLIRHAARKVLRLMKLPEPDVFFRFSIESLVTNLETYPEDEEDIFCTLFYISKNHGNFAVKYTKEFTEELKYQLGEQFWDCLLSFTKAWEAWEVFYGGASMAKPSCEGELRLDRPRVAAILVLALASSLSSERIIRDVPSGMFYCAVPLLRRISGFLGNVNERDSLLAHLCHFSGLPYLAASSFNDDEISLHPVRNVKDHEKRYDQVDCSLRFMNNEASEIFNMKRVAVMSQISTPFEEQMLKGASGDEEATHAIKLVLKAVLQTWPFTQSRYMDEVLNTISACEEELEMIGFYMHGSAGTYEFASLYIQEASCYWSGGVRSYVGELGYQTQKHVVQLSGIE
ncbi:hypothetical protein QJS04_geneDACA014670 [Acorus gramineus]|uniref:Uncharacterized protein n=1 Tax=Acorus gramineus TaxID=55184 RepID=A0AAV9B4Y4_ACOGR|nr:hypothetical protein QJS04_geneDACA014670 [Acorus gramineus]